MPDFEAYHRSIAAELVAVRNRIGTLVPHRLTDGAWKETALRAVLRRHLPNAAAIGRGFVVAAGGSSTELDLLVLKPGKPALFKDGDLMIVTPDAPAVMVEVKTGLAGYQEWRDAAKKLAEAGALCKKAIGRSPWLGLFTYDSTTTPVVRLLDAVCDANRDAGVAVNCIASGPDLFVRYWPQGEYERGDNLAVDLARVYWRAYRLEGLAPSYFLGNLVDSFCEVDRPESYYAWFARQSGKREYMLEERSGAECQPRIEIG